jgi:hydroxymethylbilane synthase
MTSDLKLAAVPERGPVEDVLVTPEGITFSELPEAAKIATGSIRRQSQLLNLRPDLQIVDLRGNIDTRLKKLKTQNLDGIIMARAAIVRLEKNDVPYYVFPADQMIPGVSQGALGIQIRERDETLSEVLQVLNHPASFNAATAERSFLHTLDSGCQFPVGAYARENDKQLAIMGFVGSTDGKKVIQDRIDSTDLDATGLGHALALRFLEKGAEKLLKS